MPIPESGLSLYALSALYPPEPPVAEQNEPYEDESPLVPAVLLPPPVPFAPTVTATVVVFKNDVGV